MLAICTIHLRMIFPCNRLHTRVHEPGSFVPKYTSRLALLSQIHISKALDGFHRNDKPVPFLQVVYFGHFFCLPVRWIGLSLIAIQVQAAYGTAMSLLYLSVSEPFVPLAHGEMLWGASGHIWPTPCLKLCKYVASRIMQVKAISFQSYTYKQGDLSFRANPHVKPCNKVTNVLFTIPLWRAGNGRYTICTGLKTHQWFTNHQQIHAKGQRRFRKNLEFVRTIICKI